MGYNRFKYLHEPNPQLYIHERLSTFSRGDLWGPIENIQNWNDFASLLEYYRDRLDKEINRDSLVPLCEETGFNHIYDEASLAQLHGISIIMPVCKSLPDGIFIKPGGEISIYNPDLRPDWGAIKMTEHGIKPIVCGDTKIGWDVPAALRFIQRNPDGYEDIEGHDIALPLEQLQHYCLGFQIAYGFILTEEYIVCCEFSLAPDIQRSPRPKRTQTKYRHNRIISTSTASTGLETRLSEMSFEPTPFFQNAGPVRIAVDRWHPSEDGREFPIKLSLWLLIMKARNHPGLRQEDASHGPSEEGQISSPYRKDKGKRKERHH